jgi:hypothetical protein
MNLELVDYYVYLYEGYHIWASLHVRSCSSVLGLGSNKVTFVGSKPLEERTLELLEDVAKNFSTGVDQRPAKILNTSLRGKYKEAYAIQGDGIKGSNVGLGGNIFGYDGGLSVSVRHGFNEYKNSVPEVSSVLEYASHMTIMLSDKSVSADTNKSP